MMQGQFTQSVVDHFYEIAENTQNVREDFRYLSQHIRTGDWKDYYFSVVEKYHLSGRFAMMRILMEKAGGLSCWKINESMQKEGYSVDGVGHFSDITMQHAAEMGEDELQRYKKLLLRRAEDAAPGMAGEAEPLIDRILAAGEVDAKSGLTREELFTLGHDLDLSLSEMQFLLLRTLGDNEYGMRLGSSSDLIDMYGFIKRLSAQQVEELKEQYHDRIRDCKIRKSPYEDKPESWTRDMEDSFEQIVEQWKSSGSEKMMQWLIEQTPFLDLRPKTALRIFRNLAAYLYPFARVSPEEQFGDDFYNTVKDCAELKEYSESARELLFDENGRISRPGCEKVGKGILKANHALANTKSGNNVDCYHVIHLNKGKPEVHGKANKGFEESEARLISILEGKIDPTKGDMLFLLWFGINYWWGYDRCDTAEDRAECMSDFLDSASMLLEKALLPEFYPPNILERSMLMSIALGSTRKNPAMVYEKICESFMQKGIAKKKKNTKNNSKERKIEIVGSYLRGEGTVQECAEKFGVSRSSLQNWLSAYRKGELH